MRTHMPPVRSEILSWVAAQMPGIGPWIAKDFPSGDRTPHTASPKIEMLAGDGSQRTFYRVVEDGRSFVLVSDPGFASTKDYFPMQRFLEKAGLPVPKFFSEDPTLGVLLMEDLGDELLQMRILAQPVTKQRWLEKTVDLLAELHRTTFPVPKNIPAASRHFDSTKYREELGFTHTHLSEGLLGLRVDDAEKKRVTAFCETIAAFGPTVLCHRDYHTRNVLVRDEELVLIDFQDARLGPPQYDLASLIYDAYVTTTGAERNALVVRYRKGIEASPLGRQILEKDFDAHLTVVALQRMAKAAGSFAGFFTRYQKATHLPFLAPCLETVAELQRKAIADGTISEELFPVTRWADAWKKHAEFRPAPR